MNLTFWRNRPLERRNEEIMKIVMDYVTLGEDIDDMTDKVRSQVTKFYELWCVSIKKNCHKILNKFTNKHKNWFDSTFILLAYIIDNFGPNSSTSGKQKKTFCSNFNENKYKRVEHLVDTYTANERTFATSTSGSSGIT